MTRDGLIEAGAQAITETFGSPSGSKHAAEVVINAVEPLIRADMDWHQKANAESAVALMQWRDELRAKVEALCPLAGRDGCICPIRDVLALLDGSN